MEAAGKRQAEPGPAGGRPLCSRWDMLADSEQKRNTIHFISSAPCGCCADEEGKGEAGRAVVAAGPGWEPRRAENCIQMH